jgi:hypothetical protein
MIVMKEKNESKEWKKFTVYKQTRKMIRKAMQR